MHDYWRFYLTTEYRTTHLMLCEIFGSHFIHFHFVNARRLHKCDNIVTLLLNHCVGRIIREKKTRIVSQA